jgi:glycosyltransferase involved in cell wall biosynthesis
MIVFLNAADVAGVGAARSLNAKSAMLAPFVDVSRFAASNDSHDAGESGCVRLVTVAIMRDGGKLASYRMLASALARMRDVRFELTIVGEGDARDRVAQAFAPIADRVQFCGMLAPDDVAIVLRRSDVFVWPAVDEVIGIALLEAQACGVPVVAGWTPGVAGIVADGTTGFLTPPGDVDAFASGVRRLATDRWLRERMRANAIAYVRAHHSVHVAAARLDAILQEVVSSRPARVPPALSTALSPVLP